MSRIVKVSAGEILDSRGNPTLQTSVVLDDGTVGTASVPSGASTGRREARELRDEDPERYGGKGVLCAVASVETEIGPLIIGRDPERQAEIDRLMIQCDGTEDKAWLGANAILSVSIAVLRAAAASARNPIYAYLGGPARRRMPVPMMNVINGGAHADNSLDFQEFMIVPHGAPTYSEALRYGVETYHALKSLLKIRGYHTNVGDEGGFAPPLRSNEEACALIVEAIEAAGFEPGRHVALALDPAASGFQIDGSYVLNRSGDGTKSSAEMTDLYRRWVDDYPIVSIEDGLGEEDWDGFRDHTAQLGGRIQIVGDDLYVTNTSLIQRGIAEGATNAVLIKPNQIGTVTETVEAIELCREAGMNFVVSHRSGETDDPFIADLAVAFGGGQIKAGAPCRGERVAKYNRLLEIERELGPKAIYESPFAEKGAVNTDEPSAP